MAIGRPRHAPHIIEAVRKLKAASETNVTIGMAVGLTPSQVANLCHQRGIRKRFSGRLDTWVGVRLVQAYQDEAAARGVSFDRFMRKLLGTVVRDNLFTAIFDGDK